MPDPTDMDDPTSVMKARNYNHHGDRELRRMPSDQTTRVQKAYVISIYHIRANPQSIDAKL